MSRPPLSPLEIPHPLGLPEGPWRCRWRQGALSGLEELALTLRGLLLTAEGRDEDGTFRHDGAIYANGGASFTKVYTRPVKPVPASMSYIGQWDGRAIRGAWIDDRCPSNQGPFTMWPGDGPEPPLTLREAVPLDSEVLVEVAVVPTPERGRR